MQDDPKNHHVRSSANIFSKVIITFRVLFWVKSLNLKTEKKRKVEKKKGKFIKGGM